MPKELRIAPISKVFDIINSCIDEDQIETCKKMTYYYVQLVKENGVVNYEEVREVLDLKIRERQEELEYCEAFC